MKNIKRLIAVVITAVMALSFTACHKKNEIAVSAGDVEFTSAYYMCALINADAEAKSKVQESLTEEESSADEIDYYSKEIDGKKYEEWVKDQAIASLKEIAAYKLLCKENEVELSDEMATNAEQYASYYWSSYGYSYYYEPNGVSEETYTKFMKDSYYSEAYFNHLYDEGGEKAISAEDVKNEIHSQFVIADILEASYATDATDEDKESLKTKLDGYVTALKDGSKTFKDVYNDYNEITEDESNNTDTDTDSETSEPKDSYAQVLGGEDTVYASDYYDKAKEMETGAIELIEMDDNAGYVLIVKQDITADDYYLEALDSSGRHLIADEEFEKLIDDYEATFELDVSKYAINRFKVKKIKEPDYSNMY